MATRIAFGNELIEIAKKNKNFFVCNPDTKSCGLENFGELFPGRAITFGIAEQNLVATAAGISSCGNKVYVPTFSVFLTLRACDQIRSLVCYPNLDVTLLGTHSGLQVGEDGGTHIALEDVAIMRTLPNMVVVEPSDEISARAIARASTSHRGPMYIRLHRSEVINMHHNNYQFELGKATLIRDYGNDVAFVASGIMLSYVGVAADVLHSNGIHAKVLEISTIKPIDQDALVRVARETNAIVVVQDHLICGGLCSAVAEVLSCKYPTKLQFIGVNDRFGESGTPESLYKQHHMTVKDCVIVATKLASDKRLE